VLETRPSWHGDTGANGQADRAGTVLVTAAGATARAAPRACSARRRVRLAGSNRSRRRRPQIRGGCGSSSRVWAPRSRPVHGSGDGAEVDAPGYAAAGSAGRRVRGPGGSAVQHGRIDSWSPRTRFSRDPFGIRTSDRRRHPERVDGYLCFCQADCESSCRARFAPRSSTIIILLAILNWYSASGIQGVGGLPPKSSWRSLTISRR
jgi:hypothetical protein